MLCTSVVNSDKNAHEQFLPLRVGFRFRYSFLCVCLAFWVTICKMVRPMLLDHCPVCNAGPHLTQWHDQWRRCLECVVQQQGGHIELLM